MSSATAVLAHGVGGSTDLPIPLSFALIGAAWALTATFGIVAFAWKRPRFDPDKAGRPLPRWATGAVDSRAVRSVIGGVALLFTAWVAMAAIWGPQGSGNALQGVFYVLLWVGLVATSLLIGPVWRVVFPIVRPTLSVLVVFIFIWSWNEFYIPLILLGDPSSQTVPIALSTLRGQHSIDITVINAGSLLSLIPTLVFFLIFQRTISRGVTAGAVK